MEHIRVRAPTRAHAARLLAVLDGGFRTDGDGFRTDGGGAWPGTDIRLSLDGDTALKLVELFDALGRWLSESGLDACQIGFGNRTYTLLPALDGIPNDPAKFLFERTIQLQTALDSRVVIAQAKGILAGREAISPDEAFERMRRQARSRRMKLRDFAGGVVSTVSRPVGTPGS